MKAHFYKVPVQLENSFSLRYDVKPDFGAVWHYHPELELHYVVKGEGLRFVGDTVRNFSAGEMVLLGPNLPHMWRCNEGYRTEDFERRVEAVVLQFLPTCLGKEFLDLPEVLSIRKLFEKASRGVLITGEKRDKVARMLSESLEASNLDRLILLLSILNLLAADIEDAEVVTSANIHCQSNELEMARIDRIYSYVLDNYTKEITLSTIASVANMSETSFCRYFKLTTNKTFFEFLTEVRVSHACRALIENKRLTEVICYESGFNNLSNFYRNFKKLTDLTPYEYKMKYLSVQSKRDSLVV